MDNSAIGMLWQNKAVRIGTLVAAVIIVLSLIYLVIIRLTPYTAYEMTPINMTSDNSIVHLEGESLYSYNNGAFIKTDVSQDTPPVVQLAGMKLPPLEQVVWAGDEGALIQLSSGTIVGTIIEEVAEWSDLPQEIIENSIWYVDFSDRSIHKITDYSLMSEQIFYSSESSSFYFLANTPESEDSAISKLHKYSIEDDKTTAIDNVTDYGNLTNIRHCRDQTSICITGSSMTDPLKVTVKALHAESHELEELVSTDGVIEPTGDPNNYIIRDTLSQEAGEVDYNLGQRQLYDVVTKQYSNINITSEANSTTVLMGGDQDKTSLLTLEDPSGYKSIAQTIFGTSTSRQHTLGQPESMEDQDMATLEFLEYGSATSLLAFDADSNLYIISPTDSIKNNFTQVDKPQATAVLSECIQQLGFQDFTVNDSLGEVRVFIAWDEAKFHTDSKRIADCLSSLPEIFTSYNVIFSGVNPADGRILLS